MKIVLINKSDKTGGAAVACRRLQKALLKNGTDAKMLVQEKTGKDSTIEATGKGFFKGKINFLHFLLERLYFLFYEASKEVRFAFSPAVSGEDITNKHLIQNTDIIHLHWFNQGYLSLNNLKQLLKTGRPIVWTLHDMWAFTGGCHYAGTCTGFMVSCGNCPFLKHPTDKDLSFKILQKKKAILKEANITFVACSKWLKQNAASSSLLKGFKIHDIPNPIDQSVFYPMDKQLLRQKMGLPTDKKIVLFAAANISDKRKGLSYLLDALDLFINTNAKHVVFEVVTFGKSDDSIFKNARFKVHDLGVLHETRKIAEAYTLADLFVLPSLEDNLPNTVMESMACGTPVLAFDTGGIPEMVEHKKTGYLASYKSVEDLKSGMEFILNHPKQEELSKNALEKVKNEYGEDVVAEKYKKIYVSLLNPKP